jgi:hypothetical protein
MAIPFVQVANFTPNSGNGHWQAPFGLATVVGRKPAGAYTGPMAAQEGRQVLYQVVLNRTEFDDLVEQRNGKHYRIPILGKNATHSRLLQLRAQQVPYAGTNVAPLENRLINPSATFPKP